MVSRKKKAVQVKTANRKRAKSKSKKGAKAGGKGGSHVTHNHFRWIKDEGIWRSGRYELTEGEGKCKLVRRADGHVVGEYDDRVTAMAKADEDSGYDRIAPRENRATWELSDAKSGAKGKTKRKKRKKKSVSKLKKEQPPKVRTTELQKVSTALEDEGYFDAQSLEDERKKTLQEVAQRQGQSQFRKNLVAAYGGRCAITGCDAEAALEAAHIIPYMGPTTNHVSNGLLLRADIHRLFDLDLIGIDPESMEIALSEPLRKTSYRPLDGQSLVLPKSKKSHPSQDALSQKWDRFVGTD